MQKLPYVPEKMPPGDIQWQRLLSLIGPAHETIGRYDGLLGSMLNPDILLSPLTTNEAVFSSRIEGTQASFKDVLQVEAGLKDDKSETIRNDVYEILNYRNALLAATKELSQRPLSLNFIRQIHKLLLTGVRGKNKAPGSFRKAQNWIGLPGSKVDTARYIPPNPMIIQEYMDDWERFMQNENFGDLLVQLAILHAQFEIIHPFNDGNGRIGRLLIPLFLYVRRALRRPVFYLSEYLEEHREEYYDRLLSITSNNDWQGWIEFFLKAVIVQSKINIERTEKVLNLHESLKNEFIKCTRSRYAVPLLDSFFQSPVINSSTIVNSSGIETRVTGNNLLKKLERCNLIQRLVQGRGQRPTVYMLPDLLNIIA
jgi:Fic family protein